ncbi:cold-responsive protein kinase 1-like isoform X2 [Neltuma alba]|uniref:cold-responsive protein kinase 1-like isoform X2 n=1 Tax=Neltuma alba TaxID=207710 RepID=UPI0010A43DC5|nr:cold-responsive protein kinase 1-like isoform X2 [Prosopis alba]
MRSISQFPYKTLLFISFLICTYYKLEKKKKKDDMEDSGVFRFDISGAFLDETTQTFNTAYCGNQTEDDDGATRFTSVAQQLLMNLQTVTPNIRGSSAAMKMTVSNVGPTIYAFAQCIETISQNECLSCLNAGYNNIKTCLSYSDGRAFADGCFMRYSTTSFFPDNQTIDIVPAFKQGAALALLLVALFAWMRRTKSPKRVPRGEIPGASKLKGSITFSYKDLKSATKNFSDENKIGEGGFGVVYKGILGNGKVVAVKKLALRASNRIDEDFESEVMLISNVHHRNLVRLLGSCSKGHDRILVYEYMKNNSLDRFLFGERKGSLNWKQRYEVILGIARGLTYLHEEFHIRIIHRDIKTNNILLDDDLQPRIADFGLARLIPENRTHLSTKFAGTLGYTAPEYAIHGQLSEKADIYSYGIVVLEIISGQKSNELKVDGDAEGEFLLQKAWKLYERGMHLELVDNALDSNDYDAEEVKKIIEIGLLCTQASAEIRPAISEIVVLLQNKGLLENMRPTMPILIEPN